MKKNTLLILLFLAMTFSSIHAQEIGQDFFPTEHTTQSRGVLGAWLVDSFTTFSIKVLNVDSTISSKAKYTYTPNGSRKSYNSRNVASTSCTNQNYTYNNKNQEIVQTLIVDDCKGKISTDHLDSSFYHPTTGLRSMTRRISTTYPTMGNPVATSSIISYFYNKNNLLDSIVTNTKNSNGIYVKTNVSTYYYNALGQLEETRNYVLSKISSTLSYTYNSFSKVEIRIISSYSTVNGSLINQSKSVFFYDQNQQYFLIKSYNNLTNLHGSSTRYYYTFSPTAVGVKEETKSSFHWLMPNPYNGQNILIASDYAGSMTLRLVDISGKTLEQQTVQADSHFQLATEANGLFFLQLSDENGKLLDTQKIVLQK